MSDENKRPPIPEGIKREVRQRCLFGCVVCGMPVFDYDHITEFSQVGEHTADNLTLLCPNHHRAKTVGHLAVDTVREWNSNPFNRNRSFTSEYKLEASKELRLKFGTCYLVTDDIPDGQTDIAVLVNGRSYLSCHREEGWLTFSAVVTDQEGNELLVIKKGELVVSTEPWDVGYVGKELTIRRAKGDLILRMTLANYELNVLSGAFVDGRDRSGFIASTSGLETIVGAQSFGTSLRCGSSGNRGAGWAVTNTAVRPWNVLEWRPR